MSQEFVAQPKERNEQSVVAGIVLVKVGWYDISLPDRDVKYIYYPGEVAKKHSYYRKEKAQVDINFSFIYSVIKEKLRSISVSSPNKQPIVVKESNKTSPKIDFSAFDINNINKMADISTIYKGEEFKDGSIHYRKDGSILYKKEAEAYKRIWNMTLFTGNEEGAVLGIDKVLVEPSYFNTPSNALFREYGYEYRDGDYFDCLSSSLFKTLGTVHTHPEGEEPSTWNPAKGTYGDLGFGSTLTPLKPVYVLKMGNVNKIAFLYSDKWIDEAKMKHYIVDDIQKTYSSASIGNLFTNTFSLINYTLLCKKAFKEHLKIQEFKKFKY